jgi:RHS repeat-associated protein
MIPSENKSSPKSKTDKPSRDNASFLNNAQENSSAAKSSLLQVPSITLPKGGGAMKGIDEKFSVNSSNGTASYTVPLPFSPGRSGQAPGLSLSYNSGGGKTTFGIGWGLAVSAIQRKTDTKLPEYQDARESDVFLLSGAEDLVPELEQDSSGNWQKVTSVLNGITSTLYRPRIEGGFSRIEKVEDNGNVYWRSRSKDNVVSVFGQSDAAKLMDPADPARIFKWCLEYTYDDKGSITRYFYKKENKDNVTAALAEKNRLNDTAPFGNIYLKSVRYGNALPFYEGDALPTDFFFELVLDYGEHDTAKPSTEEINTWPLRQDPFSDFKAGFEIRTYRLCRRILMFHHFKAELGWDDYLVRTLDFSYDEQPGITYLSSVTQNGYIWNGDGSLKSKKALPPLEFTYFKPGFSRDVLELPAGSGTNVPIGLDGRDYQWTDLHSEGIPGILSEQGDAWYYKENQGEGVFGGAAVVRRKPSFSGLSDGKVAIQDLEADGNKYLVKMEGPVRGYFEMPDDNSLQAFRPFQSFPNIDLKDPNLKFIDLDGDGKPDILISQEQEFIWYAAKGIIGFDDYHLAAKAANAEQGPQVLFSDPDAALLIATADMSGDGLSDIVLVTHAGVSYYPNLGYGRFGARITMNMDGIFDSPTEFEVTNIHLADVDGSGTTDIVYTGKDKIQVWFNESGNNLAPVFEFFNPFPELDSESKITFVDLLGRGTSCLVWSTALPHQASSPMRYIDLMGGRKPHVMFAHKNNMGKEVTIEYKSSTYFYLEDKKNGKPWMTKLPFPVQCVSKVVVQDKVSQTIFSNEYSYHHGYYDSTEREFRGFARVEQRDTEIFENYVLQVQGAGAQNIVELDLYQPALITKTWYHTGAFHHKQKLVHHLQKEYYPQNLIEDGTISDPVQISALQRYCLPENPGPANMTSDEFPEYCRSLKGQSLRQEIYSDEGSLAEQLHPYVVTQHNYEVKMLQPREEQRHASFLSREKETLVFNFERNPLDPRITHVINIATDDFGNILETVSLAYGRKTPDPLLPTDADRAQQTNRYLTYLVNTYTNLIDHADYRLPVLCETQTWELHAPSPLAAFYTGDELKACFDAAAAKLYEQTTAVNEKRKIKQSRTLFLKNDLTGPMPLGQIDTRALSYENYQLAFSPTLLQSIYGSKIDDATLRNKAGYVRSENDTNYWVRSGKIYVYPDISTNPGIKSIPAATAGDVTFAKSNFFAPVGYEDNTGKLSKVLNDAYKLYVARSIDAMDNETNVKAFSFRTLQPYLLSDNNNNQTAARFDELGQVTHEFVMGKAGEFLGDSLDTSSAEFSTLDQPGSILSYDFRYYTSAGKLPCVVKTSKRERHYYKDPQPAGQSGGVLGWLNNLFGSGGSGSSGPQIDPQAVWQDSYAYTDGSAHIVLQKIQAEPGLAPQRDAQGKLMLDSAGNPVLSDTTPALRWIGNGKTLVNNKGKTVKQYEPYFDSSFEYNREEELISIGHTAILYYDAPGRVIRTEKPDGTFSKEEFDAWSQQSFDVNDTVLESKWYATRINGQMGPDEQLAAQQTAVHAGTPSQNWFDSLGRSFMTAAHNKALRSNETVQEDYYYTRTPLDIEARPLYATDARGNTVMSWMYDMLGNICFQHSMDSGDRWMLADVMGKAFRLWDSRKQTFSYEYDDLHRPLNLLANTGAGYIVYERYVYGEGATNDIQNNLRGRLYQQCDTACLSTMTAYDFKGNLLAGTKQLLTDYKNMPDWKASPLLDTETFGGETSYDALSRPVQIITPDSSVFVPVYNEGNMLGGMDVFLDGALTKTNFISKISYNAKRQREQIYYGNTTTTRYEYDPFTSRIIRLLSSTGTGTGILQDLSFLYDPSGNILKQTDNAQKTIFYGGQQVDAQSNYIYDALYRLIEGGGREHTGQNGFNGQDNWNDNWSNLTLQPNSPVQLRNYVQKYFYDGVGNIMKMQHLSGPNANWTRSYSYNASNNQLNKTTAGINTYSYTYNEHGSMIAMPQLPLVDWNFKEEMQHANLGGAGDAYYTYDCKGNRVRKVIENGNTTSERIYLGVLEIYRERNKGSITLERQTLHIMDDKERIAMVESRTKGKDGTALQLIRYQYSNPQGGAMLELDDAGKIISYEEYHPFGTSAYRATDASRQVPARRYRYTGMERDDETGLGYHTARYYIPWLGRWTSADPIGIQAGLNVYAYASNNPIVKNDPGGTDDTMCTNDNDLHLRFCYTVTPEVSGETPHPHVELTITRLPISFPPLFVVPPTAGGTPTPEPTPAPAPDEGQPTPPPQATQGGPGQPNGRTGVSITVGRQWLSAPGGSGGGYNLGYGFNRGVAQGSTWGGAEITGNLTLPADPSGSITGASPAAGVHVWYGPDGNRFILGGYASLNYTAGQTPPGGSTNFGGTLTAAPELHLGGPDTDHAPIVLGGNVSASVQQNAQVAQTGGPSAASAYVATPFTVTGSLNLTYNPAYYPGSKVPYVSIFAEGTGGGIVTSGSVGSGPDASTRFGTVGGGASVNIRSGPVITTLGVGAGFRWQGDTVGGNTVTASGPFVAGTAGVSWY